MVVCNSLPFLDDFYLLQTLHEAICLQRSVQKIFNNLKNKLLKLKVSSTGLFGHSPNNKIEYLLNTYRHSNEEAFFENIEKAIGMAYRYCLQFEQSENGFWISRHRDNAPTGSRIKSKKHEPDAQKR